ncbi:MAG: hypothetical protein ABSD69_01770 [Candidatus Levyibacteriota bacterium]|jgi:hypothetical protein
MTKRKEAPPVTIETRKIDGEERKVTVRQLDEKKIKHATTIDNVQSNGPRFTREFVRK